MARAKDAARRGTSDVTLSKAWQQRHSDFYWYQRYDFLATVLAGLAAGAAFVLPPRGALSGLGWFRVAGFFLAYLVWSVLILADREKPRALKNAVALGIFILAGWLFYLYSSARWDRLGKVFFDLSIMSKGDPFSGASYSNWTLMLMGFWTAVQIFFFSAVMGTVLGLFLAVLRTLVKDKVLNFFIIAYVDFFRAMPMIVMLLVVYSALPYADILLSPEASGILTLGLIDAAYMSEIFRSGIEAIHAVQTEAARALGLSAWKTMRLVILPQALRMVIPPYTGVLVGLMKGTALCSTITIFELLNTASQIQAWYANPTPLIVATGFYLLILLPMTRASSLLERKWRAIGVRL
jgi:polar amino acid transport system permease protein